MKDRKRLVAVVAVEICEIYILDRITFNRCIRSDEAVLTKIIQLCQQRIKQTKAIEALHKSHCEAEEALNPVASEEQALEK